MVAIAAPAVSQKPDAGGAALKGASDGIDATRDGRELGIATARGSAPPKAPLTEASFADNSVMRAMTEANAAPVSSLAPIISLDSKTAILAVLPRQDLGGEVVKHQQFGHWFFGRGVEAHRPQFEDEVTCSYSVGVAAASRKKSNNAALIALTSANESRAITAPP
jgi:hypothetical protein